MSEERTTSRPRRPTDRTIITRALELLRAGILSSAIPARLMEEYGIGKERARELVGRTVEVWKKPYRQGKRGRLDTKPLDKPGQGGQ